MQDRKSGNGRTPFRVARSSLTIVLFAVLGILAFAAPAANASSLPTAVGCPSTSTGVANVFLSFDVSTDFTGGTAPLTYSAIGLPAGLSINPLTGVVSGTPTVQSVNDGPYSVTYTVEDSADNFAMKTCTFVVSLPSTDVPQFPLGILALFTMIIPALLVLRKKRVPVLSSAQT